MLAKPYRASVVSLALLCLGGSALSEAYPARPVRLVVPYPPGGPVDFVARAMQAKLGEALGQPIVIDNKGGAGGNIAAAEVARAKADGYTLSLIYETHVTANLFYKNLKFDAFDSFDYLSLLGYSPIVMMTSKESGLDSIPKLISAAKAAPEKLNQSITGPGAAAMLKSALIHKAFGTRVTYVPFKGSAEAMNAVISGQIEIGLASLPVMIGLAGSDRFNAIAVMTDEPSPLLPNVPPIGKYMKGVESTAWIGLVAPKGLPEGVSKKLTQSIQIAMTSPDVKKALTAGGFVVQATDSAQFLAKGRSDLKQAQDLVKEGVLQID